jgi:hypothetical protein
VIYNDNDNDDNDNDEDNNDEDHNDIFIVATENIV